MITADNENDEAEKVVNAVITHHFIKKSKYVDYAILYRGNHQARIFEKILLQNRIPYKISGGDSFFSRPEIKDSLAYLRLLTNPDDDSAFLRIINTPKREIGAVTIQKLGEWANLRHKSLFSASFDLRLTQHLTSRNATSLQRFTHWIAEIMPLVERDPSAAIQHLRNAVDYESRLYEISPSPLAAEMRMKNVNLLFLWLEEMLSGSALHEPMTLIQAVTRFTLRDLYSAVMKF